MSIFYTEEVRYRFEYGGYEMFYDVWVYRLTGMRSDGIPPTGMVGNPMIDGELIESHVMRDGEYVDLVYRMSDTGSLYVGSIWLKNLESGNSDVNESFQIYPLDIRDKTISDLTQRVKALEDIIANK